MQLTKGAIGNLINRYKAVLKKCHLLNVFGSLAVAGMLVMGGAAAAGAGEVTWDYANDITVNAGDQLTISESPSSIQGDLNIAGGAVSISGSYQSWNEENHGSINMTSGSLTITTPTSTEGVNYPGNVQVTDVDVTGGTITISGDRNTPTAMGAWNGGPMILSYAEDGVSSFSGASTIVNVDGGTIFNGFYGSYKGYSTELRFEEGVTVNLSGGSLNQAGVIHASAYSPNSEGYGQGVTLVVDGQDTKINVGDGSSTAYGVLSAPQAIISNGAQINVKNNAQLDMTAFLLSGQTVSDALQNDRVKEGSGIFTITSGASLNVAQGGTLNIHNVHVDASNGGSIANSGIINLKPGSSVSNVTFEQGTNPADKGLIAADADGNVALNGGMTTGGTATVGSVSIDDGKNISIDNAKFYDHSFGDNVKGAINATLSAGQQLTISNSEFKNISATGNSSGIDGSALTISGNGGSVVISDTTFSNNSYDDTQTVNGAYGGAVSISDAAVTLHKVTFDANHASSNADAPNSMAQGGAYYQGFGSLDAQDVKVTNNTIESAPSAFGAGMALWGVDSKLDRATFSGNQINLKAPDTYALGGGLYLRGGAWGGQEGDTTFSSISNSLFSHNTITADADANGAGLYIKGDTGYTIETNITGTYFENNTATGGGQSAGGGIYIVADGSSSNAKVNISNTHFTGNSATYSNSSSSGINGGYGGAIFNGGYDEHTTGGMLTISDSTFQNNSATTAGGAIYNAGTLTLTGDNLFSGNTAAEGKDIYNEGDITFDGTNTQMDGGMMMAKGTMAVNNSQVSMAELTAKGGEISVTGSELTVSQLTDTTLGSTLTVGTDGIVNIGNLDTTKLGEAMNDASMGSGSAVLALNTSVTLADGARLVVGNDGSKGAAAASFGDNSLLVVDAEGVTGNQVIHADGSGNKTAFIHSGAQLRIINAVAGESVTVLNGFDTIKNEDGALDAKWVNNEGVENLDYMLSSYAQIVDDNGQYDVIVVSELNDPTEALPGIDPDLAPVLNEVWANKLNDVDSPDMGVRFLSRAARADYVNGDAAKSAATIESAARIAFAGAVPQMTKMASDAATNAVVNRLGFANPADGAQAMNAEGQIVDRNTTGFALWIAPLWQSQHGWGMEAGNLDYGFNGNLGGVSLGADYTFENAIRAGITFNIGGGYAETSGGDLNSTQNNMNFWGLGAYAGWNYENFAVMADVSYTSTWNQLEQDLDPGMGMGDLEADVQATAISAGLRAEYKLETSVLDVIPHVGVRYMSLNTWGYDVDARGGTVMEGDGFHQDIWTFPVGVTFSKDFTLDSGWFFKPSLDFSVIPAAGDIKAKEDVRFTGAPAVAEMETQMMDYLTWQGGVGLEMGNDTMSFGVNYTLQAGQHTTGHGVFGSFRYEF